MKIGSEEHETTRNGLSRMIGVWTVYCHLCYYSVQVINITGQ